MRPADLHQAEVLGLIALLKHVVSSDGSLSEAEGHLLERVAAEVGEERFAVAQQEAAARLRGARAFARALAAVKRPAARRLIYSLAWEAAEADHLVTREIARLYRVAEQWGIDPDPLAGA